MPGAYGVGGEYLVQEGFGWTNGSVLRLLELFPKELVAPDLRELISVASGERRKSSIILSPANSIIQFQEAAAASASV